MVDDRFKVRRIEHRGGSVVFELFEWESARRWWQRGSWKSRGTYPTKAEAESQMRDLAVRPYPTNTYYYDRFGTEDVSW